MPSIKRFGRRVPMPSTISIKHELRMMEATGVLISALDNQECSPKEMSQIISDIGSKYQMPAEKIAILQKHYAVR